MDVSRTRIAVGDSSFAVAGRRACVWNSLPTTLRQTTSCAQFSRRLNTQPRNRNTLRVLMFLPCTNIRILTIFHNFLQVVDFVTRFQPFFCVHVCVVVLHVSCSLCINSSPPVVRACTQAQHQYTAAWRRTVQLTSAIFTFTYLLVGLSTDYLELLI